MDKTKVAHKLTINHRLCWALLTALKYLSSMKLSGRPNRINTHTHILFVMKCARQFFNWATHIPVSFLYVNRSIEWTKKLSERKTETKATNSTIIQLETKTNNQTNNWKAFKGIIFYDVASSSWAYNWSCIELKSAGIQINIVKTMIWCRQRET